MGATVLSGIFLFAAWVVLSGKLDVIHLGAGAAIAAAIAIATRRLWALPPVFGASPTHPFADLRRGRFVLYLLVLGWEIVVSAFQVAAIVLNPRLPIEPRMLRFRSRLPHSFARLLLANSITLTPGTVTIEVEGDDFVVHALTAGTAQGIELGRLRNWIAGLFDPGARANSTEAAP